MSIRCADESGGKSYFVTYDVQTNHFVFESPVGNVLPGEITKTSDEELELTLSVFQQKIVLYFDRRHNVMWWPGPPAHEIRTRLRHACVGVTDRTMLSTSEPRESNQLRPADIFSLRCHGHTTDYFVTLDLATKVVAFESEAGGARPGEITGMDGHEIRFKVRFDRINQLDLVWNEQGRTLTWIGIPDNPNRPTESYDCVKVGARSILEEYGRLAR